MNILDMLRAAWSAEFNAAAGCDPDSSAWNPKREADVQHILATSLDARSLDVTVTEDWQPIETAPKDGTEILVYEPNFEHAAIYVCKYDDPVWIEAGGECYATWQPTHWMPLPKAPHI